MKDISLPTKIDVNNKSDREAVITIGPFFPGYGMTVGNSLRRILLSSLPGAAIIAVKIKGIDHEFSSLDNVKEDIVDIILNLKQVRFKLFADETDEDIKFSLKVSGQKKVTAADINTHSLGEITSPDVVIATLTDKSAKLEMEFIVNRGRGYIPREQQNREKKEVGMISIDAVYTPIEKVGFKVEDTRVGQMTNYNKLILDITTDGTITPEEALKRSAEVVVDHFTFIASVGSVGGSDESIAKEEDKPAEDLIEDSKK